MDINEVKDAVLSTLGQAVDGAKGLAGRAAAGAKTVAGTVAGKAKSGGSIVRLSMDAATARENLKKIYVEIGRLYYETHKDAPEEAFVQLFEEIRETEELLAAKQADLSEHKGNLREGFASASGAEDEADFADVVEQAEAEAEAAMEHIAEAESEAASESVPEDGSETAAEDVPETGTAAEDTQNPEQ